jgi:hypothetical protein
LIAAITSASRGHFYDAMIMQYHGRLIMLSDRARVLARCDPETMPS